ncbi:MAG TPA: ATP-binding protein [Nitrospiraceae bacterium]|nr:ATP-binding protein [Nitrospiraceae bacterium]
MARWSSDQSGGMSLQTKVSVVVLLIVVISAAFGEYIDRGYVSEVARGNFHEEMMAVVRQIGASITTPFELRNHTMRERELDRLMATRPDLIDVAIYAFSPVQPGQLALVATAGSTMLPALELAPALAQRALATSRAVSAPQHNLHRLQTAAPISLEGKVVGAAYAEFTTAQFDEVLEYQRRLSITRRLLTGGVIVLAINLFLYWYVHRPVRALLSAVKAVTQGTMTATVPVHGKDEIGKLAGRFNIMVERIRTTTKENKELYEALQRAHDCLQIKVEEATAEVWQKNRELARTNELLSSAQRDAARAQRLSVIGQLAATVAHKIGTPLTALSGHIQLLQEDPNLTSEARRRLHTVERQIEQTSRIIQDLLIYARKPEPVMAPLDLNACVDECLALLRPEIDRQNVMLVADLDAAVGKVVGDQQQLQEVFCNLIDNALDAMPQSGTLTVRSRLMPASKPGGDEGRCVVEIADTGQGIAPELKDQIFQPFFTTKRAGRGTGLGLAIAMETIRAHEGSLTVESEPGKGARFIVQLPISGG